MTRDTDTPTSESAGQPAPAGASRLPSARLTAVLAAAMLAAGVAVGAAIGPAPDASFAGGSSAVAQRLPALIATLAERARAQAPAAPAPVAPPAVSPQEAPRAAHRRIRRAASATAPASPAPALAPAPAGTEETGASSPSIPAKQKPPKLPATTSVWLIELAGGSFAEALAKPAAAPYITGQLIPAATYVSGWSALSASAFAGEAAIAEPTTAGGTPALMRSIVQPPCPEGPAGVACGPETPGQLTTADEFLKATLAQITPTPAYREHGLIVITFTTVAVATQAGLAAGTSSATLTSQPPAGVVLLSPFAKGGARPTAAFNPTSPRQSLQQLLR